MLNMNEATYTTYFQQASSSVNNTNTDKNCLMDEENKSVVNLLESQKSIWVNMKTVVNNKLKNK